MSTNANVCRRVLGAVVVAALWTVCNVLGCGSSSSPFIPRDAGVGGDATSVTDEGRPDAAEANPGRCTFVDSQCVGAPKCCPVLVGRRVDREAHCVRQEPIPIGCATVEDQCLYAIDFGCYVRTTDAGTEILLTGADWPNSYIPGLSRCDGPAYLEAEQASRQLCP